jgi:large subunit ribosomal protein L6
LNLVGVGYRVEDLEHGKFNFKLGYSNNIMIENDEEALINLLKPTIIQVKGTNKQKVSQKAAELRKVRSPEPYKGKGIVYKNETLIRREGKKLS